MAHLYGAQVRDRPPDDLGLAQRDDVGVGGLAGDETHLGDELARRGYVVLAVDALGWGDRGPTTYEEQQALASNLYNLGSSLAGLMAREDVRAAGFLAGATVGYHAGERFPTLMRLGVGVLLGEARDERTGTFKATAGGSYATDPIVDFPSATYLYIDPEARVGLRLGEHLELSAGVKLLMLVALSQPKWDTSLELAASTDGIGTYPPESVMGGFVFLASPGISLRYDY